MLLAAASIKKFFFIITIGGVLLASITGIFADVIRVSDFKSGSLCDGCEGKECKDGRVTHLAWYEMNIESMW